jgi:hypothetical protein
MNSERSFTSLRYVQDDRLFGCLRFAALSGQKEKRCTQDGSFEHILNSRKRLLRGCAKTVAHANQHTRQLHARVRADIIQNEERGLIDE